MKIEIGKIRSIPNGKKTFNLEGQLDDATPVHIWGTVRHIEHVLYLTAQADVAVRSQCDRCLKSFVQSYHLDIEDVFYPEGQKVDDIDFYKTYNGNQLKLNPVINNHILLEIGMQNICRPDCKGICSICGTDLNRGKCSCEKELIDPRLAVLKNLKIEE